MHGFLRARSTPLPAGVHFGHVTEVREFGGLVLAESHYAPGLTTPWHTHETASFTISLHGGYLEEHRTRTFDCFPGKTLFRTAGGQHCNRIGPSGAHCLMLEMRASWQERLVGTRLPSSACQIHDRDGIFLRLRRELALGDDIMPLAVEALVLELCCQLQRACAVRGRIPMWLRQIREKLEAEFAGKHSLKALADHAAVHPAHLARAFRQHFGCSVGEYVRRRRVVFACERIAAGDPLSHIAIDAGFANQPHLSRTFKTITGRSPGEFRREKCKGGAKDVLGVKDSQAAI